MNLTWLVWIALILFYGYRIKKENTEHIKDMAEVYAKKEAMDKKMRAMQREEYKH